MKGKEEGVELRREDKVCDLTMPTPFLVHDEGYGRLNIKSSETAGEDVYMPNKLTEHSIEFPYDFSRH